MISLTVALALASLGSAAVIDKRQGATVTVTATATTSTVPDYFQASPAIFEGFTSTGSAPFLAETNPAPFVVGSSFAPNRPLETALPISGNTNNANIFQLMGNLSPYFPNPSGFGVDEFPLPAGANISVLNTLSRHGSRYPTSNSSQQAFGMTIQGLDSKGVNFTGALSFLNTWTYKLGSEILIPKGNQELFDSGVLHYFDYGYLYKPNTTIVARTTTEERMRETAMYFLTGFFGLNWQNYAKLEFIIDESYFNNSLAGYNSCNNSNSYQSAGGTNASEIFIATYLQNATNRFNSMSPGYNFSVSQVYAAQGMCPYETIALGYSAFCDLFTYQEWLDFEYSIDLSFAGQYGFQSPTGRAVGVGYVEEVLARFQGQLLTVANSSANITLDSMSSTFPLNQTIYLDFSHDVNIAAVLTAFGLTQFSQFLPTTGPPANQQMIVSHMEPFGARLDIEVINTPLPVLANRTSASNGYAATGSPTQYVHFVLNQRTIPLGASLPSCGNRTDGWCEMATFIAAEQAQVAMSNYEYACFGNYPSVPYGTLMNGAPQSS